MSLIKKIKQFIDGSWQEFIFDSSFTTNLNLENSEGEGSVQQKGYTTEDGSTLEGGTAISNGSSALGVGTVAGSKAFNITNYNPGGKNMTLDSVEGLAVGMVCSCQFSNNFDFFGKIGFIATDIKTVVFDAYPELQEQDTSGTDRKMLLWIPEHPELGTTVIGTGANAKGYSTKANQVGASAEGYKTIAGGKYGHAEGKNTKAGYAAHSEGQDTQALSLRSHAEGLETVANGDAAHAEGYNTKATEQYTHAQNNSTEANGDNSSSAGYQTRANYANQFVAGQWNDNKEDTLFEVGNGTSDEARSNAFEVRKTASVLIGGNRYDHEDGDQEALLEGKQSLNVGGGNQTYGDWNIAMGKENRTYQKAATALGGETQAGMTEEEFNTYGGDILGGRSYNESYSFATAIGEQTKSLGRGGFAMGQQTLNTGLHGFAGGTKSENHANHGFAFGDQVILEDTATGSAGFGYQVAINDTHAFAANYRNTVNAQRAAAFNESNTVNGVGAFAANYGNTIDANYAFVANNANKAKSGAYASALFGVGNESNYQKQFIVGTYNSNKEDTIVEVGNGDSGTRRNAFEVYKDGSISLDNGTTKLTATEVSGLVKLINGLEDGKFDALIAFANSLTATEEA